MKVRSVENAYREGELVECWLESLSASEKNELAQLDYKSSNSEVQTEITKDWIEEHNGQRDFWGFIRTDLTKEDQ